MGENIWYVYSHTRLDKNEIFYIGIGKTKNYKRAYEIDKSKRNKIWNRITQKSLWTVKILHECLSKEEASLKEQELIKFYGRIDIKTGILSNMTDGGDGVWGNTRSDEFKKKCRENKLGTKNPMFGKPVSTETRLKRSISSTGLKRTKETKEKQKLGFIKSGYSKPIIVSNYISNEIIGEWDSIAQACRDLNIIKSNGKVSMVLKGKRNQTNGYSFKYK